MIRSLSHSAVSLYLTCGRKFRYRYLDGLRSPRTPALVFGAAIHTTIGAYFKARAAGVAFDLSRAWTEAFDAELATEIDWGGCLPDLYRADGLALLSSRAVMSGLAGLKLATDENGDPILERRIQWLIDGMDAPVIGYIDAIAADGAAIDFKTSDRRWSLAQAEMETQPLIYLAALAQMGFPHAPGEFTHVVIVKTREAAFQTLDTTHTADEMRWMEEVIRQAWRGINAGVFPPNANNCFKWGRPCEFLARCRKEV